MGHRMKRRKGKEILLNLRLCLKYKSAPLFLANSFQPLSPSRSSFTYRNVSPPCLAHACSLSHRQYAPVWLAKKEGHYLSKTSAAHDGASRLA